MTRRIAQPRDQRPKPTLEQRRKAAAQRRVDAADEQRKAQAERAQQEATERDQKHAEQCRAIALKRAAWAGLDDVAAKKLANTVEAHRQRAVAAGETFDPFKTIAGKLPSLGVGVRPHRGGSPLDTQRPAQTSDLPATATDDERERAEERRRAAHERGRRLAEQNRRDREAYAEALARFGLSDPSHPRPGSGTSGLGR